jgi:KaiC/GvpD/RAD55 family RecA-like ATPase
LVRLRSALAVIILLTVIMSTASISAQSPITAYIALYAHTANNARILNALPSWGGMRTENVSGTLSFNLSPSLGQNLRINGSITLTVYLRGSLAGVGNLEFALAELKSTGEQVQVPGARIQSPVVLDTRLLPFTVGVGIIYYEFQRGSSIVLSVRVDSKGTSYLVWDDASTPTSVTIPAVDPIQAAITFQDHQSQQVGIVQTEDSANLARLRFSANVTDSIGAYRLSRGIVTLIAPNGTSTSIQPIQQSTSPYTISYNLDTVLGIGSWQINLEVSDQSGGTYTFSNTLVVAPFYQVKVNVIDSSGKALENATVGIFYQQLRIWTGLTNATGWITFALPSTEIVGPLNLTVSWFGVQMSSQLKVSRNTMMIVTVPVFDKTLRLTMGALPVLGATIRLVKNNTIVAQSVTGYDGVVTIKSLPRSDYTLTVHYFFSEFNTTLSVNASDTSTIGLPVPHETELLSITLVLGSVALVTLDRRRRKTYPRNFGYFNQITSDGLPETCFALVVGNSGAGKSVLLETLAIKHLSTGASIYITNTEYPSKIRENMASVAMPEEQADLTKIVFVDAYSAIGGAPSVERFNVSSHTDLTGLGLLISKCLDETGPGTDLYFDSISPLLADLRVNYVLNFLNSVAVKVKANRGKLCVASGTGIDKSDLTKIEEAVDCVIETQLQESRRGQSRRLRIKKLRGKPYVDKWVNFRIESGKGIVFFTRTKPKKEQAQPESGQRLA